MSEYVTRAIVLGVRSSKEHDKIFDLYTESFGRVKVRAPGGKKILSKLSPHLDVMNLALVKIVEKNNLTLVDALSEDDFKKSKSDRIFFRSILEIGELLKRICPEAVPDNDLWFLLLRSLKEGKVSLADFLIRLGYDVKHASCEICGSKDVDIFGSESQTFFCRNCSLKTNENNLLYL
ncbi:DNA repair protein RecO [Patescibacteria group bacterium]|nr:DNA repair protein RecO [Patescibacteria group bacterium]